MIEKINYGEKFSIEEGFNIIADKINEIIDQVNMMSNNMSSIKCATNTIASKVSNKDNFSEIICDSDSIKINCGELRVNAEENFKATISDLKIEYGKIDSLL